jgi:hypothetical protein
MTSAPAQDRAADQNLGRSAHGDRKTRLMTGAWPRLLDVRLAAEYLTVGPQTIRDYVADRLLAPVPMPASAERDSHGNLISSPSRRKISKFLFDIRDLDKLVDERKDKS